jgi:NTE family protein
VDLQGKRVALALGGGGARGCAHLGAIDEIEARGAEIIAIAGTSMGAIIGGMYAADKLEPYRDWLEGLTYRDVLRMLDPALRSPGLIAAEKIMLRVRELIGPTRIEELRLPFTAIATELLTGKEVWFQHGPLERAIRASIAIPSVITPLVEGGKVFVDGGLVDLVPVTPLTSAHADLIIAVSVVGSPGGAERVRRPAAYEEVEDAQDASTAQRDQDMVHRIMVRLGWEAGEARDPVDAEEIQPVNLRTLDVMELSIQTMQRMITRYQLASFPPDVFIELPTNICGTMEFHRAKEVAERGRVRTIEVLDAMTD